MPDDSVREWAIEASEGLILLSALCHLFAFYFREFSAILGHVFQAFQFGPLLVWTSLVFTLVGLWLAGELFLRLAESANLSLQHFRTHGWWYLLAFGIGGRALAIIIHYQVYLREPIRMLMFNDGSFSLLGGMIGVAVVLRIVTHGHRALFLQWLDVLMPSITLGLAFTWLGNFFAGSGYGRPTDVFWGITYDVPDVRYTIPVHPVQLYYAFCFGLLTFVLLVIRKRSQRVGAETLAGIILAALLTCLLEEFRGDFSVPVFTTSLDIALLILLFISLGMFTLLEVRLTTRLALIYELSLVALTVLYMFVRPWLDLEPYEFRLTQLSAVMALLLTVVYVTHIRRRHPYF